MFRSTWCVVAICSAALLGCPGEVTGPTDSGTTATDSGTGGDPDSGTTTPMDSGTQVPDNDAGYYGAVRCPNAAYLVCDDFENGFDASQWSTDTANGTITNDGTRAARGTKSMHSVINAGGQKALLSGKKTLTLSGGHLWGRVFMYVPASAKSSLGRVNFVTAFGNNASGGGAVYAAMIGGDPGSFGALFFQFSPGVDESSFVHYPKPYDAVPLDRWFCLEWDFNHQGKQIALYLDGALMPKTVLSGFDAPNSAKINVGPEYGMNEVWFDSVAMAATRIGCGN